MIDHQTNTLRCYHYTGLKNYLSMKTGEWYGKKGLLPCRMFAKTKGLPDEAYGRIIEALLEPEPSYCTENIEFPHYWYFLMHDICKDSKTLLLSFDIFQSDDAHIVDRAHVERELYKEEGESTEETMTEAYRLYFESRVPPLEYSQQEHNYILPQLVIWSPIKFDRLRIEEVLDTNKVWNRVLENNW